MAGPLEHIARRLVELHGLSPERARAAVADVLDGLNLTADQFICERHEELKRAGLANEAIYARIRQEMSQTRFRAPSLSDRQIRRRIYG